MNHAASTTAAAPSQQPNLLDVLIVGGGLSGLMVAKGLSGLGATWKMLEARPILGGRLANDKRYQQIDMGGAWLWPRQQPVVRQFLAEHKDTLQTFPQPDDPSSIRVKGGAVQMVHALFNKIGASVDGGETSNCNTSDKSSSNGRIHLNSPVKSCRLVTSTDVDTEHESATEENVQQQIVVETLDGRVFRARNVVFAVPPKLLEKHVTFDPPLSQSKQAAMAAQHTWMAGVTKVALVYPERFWSYEYSNFGLPSSFTAPAFQVYDSGTEDGSIHSLTFFCLARNIGRGDADAENVLARQVADQMALAWKSLGQPAFAKKAHSYSSYHVQQWPLEKYISENDQPMSVRPHPSPVKALSTTEWDGMLHFCGTETDQQSPGVIAGALGSAHRVLRALKKGATTAASAKADATSEYVSSPEF